MRSNQAENAKSKTLHRLKYEYLCSWKKTFTLFCGNIKTYLSSISFRNENLYLNQASY